MTSFHQQPATSGSPDAASPSCRRKEQADSLEFRAYADLVREALVRKGWSAPAEGQAELAVTIRYSVDSGQAVTYGYPAYGYASYGPAWGWSPYYGPGGMCTIWGAAYPVGYGVVGTSYSQWILYRRELRVEITDPRAGGNERKGGRLFEGTVMSEGESASLAPVMPAMVRALFSDFPGPSGVSRRGPGEAATVRRRPRRCRYRLRRRHQLRCPTGCGVRTGKQPAR